MYAVIEYYNYRKEQYVKFLHTYRSLDAAKKRAYQYAKEEYSFVTEGVEEVWLTIRSEIAYTRRDGYDAKVFAVVKLPQVEDGNAVVPT